MQWNNLDSYNLYIGQILTVSNVDPQPDPDPKPSEVIHTVQAGEYLWLIAQEYGVTVQELIQWNSLSTPALYVGQRLLVVLSQ